MPRSIGNRGHKPRAAGFGLVDSDLHDIGHIKGVARQKAIQWMAKQVMDASNDLRQVMQNDYAIWLVQKCRHIDPKLGPKKAPDAPKSQPPGLAPSCNVGELGFLLT